MRWLWLMTLVLGVDAGTPVHVEKPEWTVDAKLIDGALSVDLAARAGFHLNDDYPLNLQVKKAEGLSLERTRFERAQMTFTPCAAEAERSCAMRLRAPASAQPGPPRLEATLAFSACNPERCLIEKVKLALP